ncbi:lysozyme inhibitor LprI family protein [Pseudoalteromonas sp. T1lg76]|uniref:lysozyme inhibitor LprI family protein n=1 Tax=Pseudoalteromonas sp. T1lg76 TaxID=2077103 RepID=UPI000CF6D414|nr:lysozyme inhibitor LprI family protein [Pseudoalteromonas sp. T1lg76]
MKQLVPLLLFIPLFAFAEEAVDCEKAWTTLAINQCMHKALVAAEKAMAKYLAKSLERYAQDNVSATAIQKGQDAWLSYREAHCGAVYDTWRDGTIRTAMGLGCKLELTHQRTAVLWQSFLTYVDSTPPLLPEPNSYEPKSY